MSTQKTIRTLIPCTGQAWNNGHETAAVLIENGANINARNEDGDTPLHWAAWRNVYEAKGVSLEGYINSNPTDKSGYTLLHWAAWRNAYKTAAMLFRKRG